jgi:predicted RNA-binding Zn ribbon-like protein
VLFAHDTEATLTFTAALINTGRGAGGDTLTDLAALEEVMATTGAEWTGVRARDERELEAVRALRPRLAAIWTLDSDGAAELVNTVLREAGAIPQLVKHGGWDYHFHAASLATPLAQRMAVESAMAFADLIRANQLDRLRLCAAADCDDVLVDLSKNHSRRFCSTACSNRVNVAAYRARRPAARREAM